jgi:hypothetical protein
MRLEISVSFVNTSMKCQTSREWKSRMRGNGRRQINRRPYVGPNPAVTSLLLEYTAKKEKRKKKKKEGGLGFK